MSNSPSNSAQNNDFKYQSHSFNVEDAIKYGTDCAILLQHFRFWISQNKRQAKNFHEGKTWMYQTHKEIAAIYPYWSEDVVYKLVKKLETEGAIIKSNFNKSWSDRTIWYALNEDNSNNVCETVKERDAKPSKDGMTSRQTTAPIPDTKKDAKEEQQQDNVAVVVFSCIKDLKISEENKIFLSKNFLEEDVANAVNWSKHPSTKISKTLDQALIWAAKNKPKIPKSEEEKISENKKKSIELEPTIESPYAYYTALTKYVEIAPKHGGISQIVEYFRNDFADEVNHFLKKYEFVTKKEFRTTESG